MECIKKREINSGYAYNNGDKNLEWCSTMGTLTLEMNPTKGTLKLNIHSTKLEILYTKRTLMLDIFNRPGVAGAVL